MKKTLIAVMVFGSMFFAGYNNPTAKADAYYQDSSYYEMQEALIAAIDTYSLKLRIHVPRIYDNAMSLGSRKYLSLLVVGKMQLCYSSDGSLVDIRFIDLVNKTHKMSDEKNVQYTTLLAAYPRFSAIGSNKTKKFNVASICFSIAAEPNYSIGLMNEDNSLYITLAGKGRLSSSKFKFATGYVAGTIGCGCSAYGHKSPTRKIGYNGATSVVDDIAAVHGRWSMKLDR